MRLLPGFTTEQTVKLKEVKNVSVVFWFTAPILAQTFLVRVVEEMLASQQ